MYMYVSREMIEECMKASMSKEKKKGISIGEWEERIDQVERFLYRRDYWLESLVEMANAMYDEGYIIEERVKKERKKKNANVAVSAEIVKDDETEDNE